MALLTADCSASRTGRRAWIWIDTVTHARGSFRGWT
jgi:hypothetical protein